MSTKLTLTGTVNFTKEQIDPLLAAKVIALVEQDMGGGRAESSVPVPLLMDNGSNHEDEDVPRMFAGKSLLSAFDTTKAKTNMQKVAVAGKRSMEENGTESFTSKDISEQFRTSGISSKNLARDIRKAVAQGLVFAETGKRGQFRVTEKALEGFVKGFDKIKLRSQQSSSTKKSRGGVVEKVEVSNEVGNLSIEPSMDNYSNYHDYKTKGERILWLLAFAKKVGIESLNTKEIEYLARQVGDNIEFSSVSALTAGSLKKGLVAKDKNKYRILRQGELHLGG